MATSGRRMITNRFVPGHGLLGELCPTLGADWEWRSAANCGQMRSGAAIVAVPSASDVLALAGTDVGAHDRLVAATAITAGWRVGTANIRHFDRIPGLDVVVINMTN
jgi:hypothetical protein